ncbi:MAG TPA: tetratricopeptide repeat protein [Thermohalobaculum sp.]|nr:tetratricopeptide repeat protein [Thermohalobaculum sp.]
MLRPDQNASGGSANVGGDVGGDVTIGYTPAQHEAALQKRLDELRSDLEAKHLAIAEAGAAKQELLRRDLDQLQSEKAEVERRQADLDTSYKEAVAKIAELEALLAREGNEIGADRMAEARAALERGDFSKADALFAEIEAREAMAVQSAARAAYGRGEIAEEQVRWGDAAAHYRRAAGLHRSYDHLRKAVVFTWRAGDYVASETLARELAVAARSEFGADSAQVSYALDRQATAIQYSGRFAEAEPLFRQALEIGEKTIGTEHPDYAASLNNLALLLRDMGRFDEAEPLYRQAIEIDEKTVGTEHPDYAIDLNNLALLLRDMGRFDEAEPLYRQAIEIDAKTIGTGHPHYANHLNNLAGLLQDMGRLDEAGPLCVQALEILRAKLGPEHPTTKTVEGNYAIFLEARDGG